MCGNYYFTNNTSRKIGELFNILVLKNLFGVKPVYVTIKINITAILVPKYISDIILTCRLLPGTDTAKNDFLQFCKGVRQRGALRMPGNGCVVRFQRRRTIDGNVYQDRRVESPSNRPYGHSAE